MTYLPRHLAEHEGRHGLPEDGGHRAWLWVWGGVDTWVMIQSCLVCRKVYVDTRAKKS